MAVPVTSHDVARAAGVSQPTVSRALRDDPDISARTKARVLEAATSLGYVANELGRNLSTRTTRRVALVADLDNPLWPLLVAEIHDELGSHGYTMTLLAERGDRGMQANLLGGWADGVIITSALLDARLPVELARRDVPFVLVNRTIEALAADCAVADNEAGGRAAAAQLLLEAGHTRVGALFGPTNTSTGRDRERGFRNGLAEAGVALRPADVRYGPFDYAHGRASLPGLIAGRSGPTAVFCANDIIAIGAMNAAHEMGVRVPDDVALVGFDDLEQVSWPVFNLTTIKVPFQSMLRGAVAMLLDRLAGHRADPRRMVHPVTPVLRGTHRFGGD